MTLPRCHSIRRILALCKSGLAGIVDVEVYDYAPCYLWHDRPLYDCFGDEICRLKGNTIYLYRDSTHPVRDLFHELGHVVGRKCDLVGHAGNGFRGSWERRNRRLIAQVAGRRHWSRYLNLLAVARDDFSLNAASEIWAELFMLWHLYPQSHEARLLDEPMQSLRDHSVCSAVAKLAFKLGTAGFSANRAATTDSIE